MNSFIGQNQDNTHLNRQQVVPHEVTCNPTDNTAHDDELSNSFASNRRDSNHHLHSIYNQMNHHGSHYSHSNAYATQQMQTFCPMLPPLQTEYFPNGTHKVNAPRVNVNHHLDHQSNHMNQQKHSSTNPLFTNASTTQPIMQRPQQLRHCSKTPVKNALLAIARLERNSIASPNSSIYHNDTQVKVQ